MNFNSLDELGHHVEKYAQSAPYPLIEAELRRAATEFCRRTRCWRHVETVELDGSPEIVIDSIQEYAQVFEVEFAEFEKRRLKKRAYSEIPVEDFEATPVSGQAPEFVTQLSPQAIFIVPTAIGEVRLSLFLEPSISGRLLPTEVSNQFGHYIADGALARILLIPGQPYTNPQLAVMFETRFEQACDRFASFHLRGQQRAPVRVKSSWC